MNRTLASSKIISAIEKNFKTENDSIKKINLDNWPRSIVVICNSGRHFSLRTDDNILWMKEFWSQRIDKAIKIKKF